MIDGEYQNDPYDEARAFRLDLRPIPGIPFEPETRPDPAGGLSELDRLTTELLQVRAALEFCHLPGFRFRAETIGGRAGIRVGKLNHFAPELDPVHWGKFSWISGPIKPLDVAGSRSSGPRDLWLAEVSERFTFEGAVIFRKGG